MTLFCRYFFLMALLLNVACRQKGATPTTETAGPKNQFVFAEPSLPLRDQGAPSGKILTVIPFGAAVILGNTSAKMETIEGKTGYWAQTTYEGKSGWVFSGWLSPVPMPQANCPGILDYARLAFTPEGQEIRTYDDPAQAKSGGSYNWQQKFTGNIRAEGYVTPDHSNTTLFVPVRDDEVGFQICKRCTAHFRLLTYAAFKEQSATIKECGWHTKQGGCLKIWFLEVSPVENGLLLKCGGDSI